MASPRRERPRRSRRASTRPTSRSRPRSSCWPEAASGRSSRSTTGSGGRRGSSAVSRPRARSSASRPGCPNRSASAREGSAASSPSVLIPSCSRISGSAWSSGRVRSSATGSGVRNSRASRSSTTTASARRSGVRSLIGPSTAPRLPRRRRGLAWSAAACAAKRLGAAPKRAPAPSARRDTARTSSSPPPWMPSIGPDSKHATPERSDSTSAPSPSSLSSTWPHREREPSGSGGTSLSAGQRDSASPMAIPRTTPKASAGADTSPTTCSRPASGASAAGSERRALRSPSAASSSKRG